MIGDSLKKQQTAEMEEFTRAERPIVPHWVTLSESVSEEYILWSHLTQGFYC